MATCFLTLCFEVSTLLASNFVIWSHVSTLYLLRQTLSNGFKVLIHNVNHTSKLYCASANMCCFTGEIREYDYYAAREDLL